jgi:hypothetical protein
MTYKELYNKKYGYKQNESHNLSEISKDSNVSIKGLQQIYNKGIGAYKTNPQSVRPNVTSKEQWAMARVYSAVMGGKVAKIDASELKMKDGGDISKHSEIYNKWKKLVNMSAAELKTFMDSADGKKAGLSKEQADKLGINYGRESAKWIIKMKQTPVAQWTDKMWYWANRQISFNSRMKGNKGKLFDENGNKTRKHLSLLIWGHNPLKYADGGNIHINNYTIGGL